MATPPPPPLISTSTLPPLQVYPPFLAKNFVPPPQVNQFSEGPTPPFMMNLNGFMVVVLKDIILCLLGFRFRYIVYIS